MQSLYHFDSITYLIMYTTKVYAAQVVHVPGYYVITKKKLKMFV